MESDILLKQVLNVDMCFLESKSYELPIEVRSVHAASFDNLNDMVPIKNPIYINYLPAAIMSLPITWRSRCRILML